MFIYYILSLTRSLQTDMNDEIKNILYTINECNSHSMSIIVKTIYRKVVEAKRIDRDEHIFVESVTPQKYLPKDIELDHSFFHIEDEEEPIFQILGFHSKHISSEVREIRTIKVSEDNKCFEIIIDRCYFKNHPYEPGKILDYDYTNDTIVITSEHINSQLELKYDKV